MNAEKLSDEALDKVVGGTTAETKELTDFLMGHGLWDGKGSISDAVNKALGVDNPDGSWSHYSYSPSDNSSNGAGIEERWYNEQRGCWNRSYRTLNHDYIMNQLREQYK